MKQSPKILIVEDEGVIAMNLRRKLEQMGFNITSVVDNSTAALDQAIQAPPDLVLMDIILNGKVDGIETAKKLRGLQDVPVIFLTAHSDESTVERAKATLPYGYLIKPFEERELKTTIEMALYRHGNEALQRLQEQAILSATSGIVVAQSHENEWPIVLHNPAFERLTGRPNVEIPGHDLLTFFSSKLSPNPQEEIRTLLANEAAGQVTICSERADGKVYWADLTVNPVHDNAGKETHRVVVLQDATERVLGERVARRSQRLESIGTMASGVAHDLNNAISPIMMGVQLLKIRYPSDTKMVDLFDSSVKRAAEMVRQLLTFAKGAEGQRVQVQPHRLVKEMNTFMRGSFPKNIQLHVTDDVKLPAILGDATQIHQVILNLCVNARDAMPHGGTLTLKCDVLEVDAAYASSSPDAKPGQYVQFKVSDTGTGISPEIIDLIFDPFFSTKGPETGTGLGLSTVLGIIKGHGGFLQVESEIGKGATFIACFPSDQSEVLKESKPTEAEEFRGDGETILFVDDEQPLRQVAALVLSESNFKPVTATDGADGIIEATKHRDELYAVITDLDMPHMDGVAFVRVLRRILPVIPVIACSGRNEAVQRAELNTLGVTKILDKPFTKQQLVEALEEILG